MKDNNLCASIGCKNRISNKKPYEQLCFRCIEEVRKEQYEDSGRGQI